MFISKQKKMAADHRFPAPIPEQGDQVFENEQQPDQCEVPQNQELERRIGNLEWMMEEREGQLRYWRNVFVALLLVLVIGTSMMSNYLDSKMQSEVNQQQER